MRGSRNFRQGGGGGGGSRLAYFAEDKWSVSKKSIIFQGSRGGPTFSRGGGGGPHSFYVKWTKYENTLSHAYKIF